MEKKDLKLSPDKTNAPLRRSRKKVDIDALRRDAGLQLLERLQKGELSTADLLKVMAFSPPENQQAEPKKGDWVLVLQGGESE